MRSYVKNRVAELREHLGPTLKDLGLMLKVADGSYDTAIFFRGKLQPGMVDPPRSPVSVRFDWPRKKGAPPEAEWSDAVLAVDDWRPRALGRTGWSHRRMWGADEVRIVKTGKEMFTWIEKAIRKQGVFTPSGQPLQVSDERLADAFWAIGRDIKDLGIVRLDFERGPRDAITFQDHLGRRIHMVYSGGGTLMIDGEEVGTFDHGPRHSAVLAEFLKTGNRHASHFFRPLTP